MTKIKIISGWSNPGGSTTSFINLCNYMNANGMDCTFYGPHDYHRDKCKSGHIAEAQVNQQDEILIIHYLKFPQRPEASKKVILACHEKDVYKVKDVKPFWDDVAYVSNSQMFWQGVPGKVIPNIITDLVMTEKHPGKKAAVIGSIDRNKNTHVSIQRALDDGFKKVLLYGMVTDQEYYKEHVESFVGDGKAIIKGYKSNTQEMYDSITDVYHSSLSETFNLIKAECEATGTHYHGLDSAESGAEYLEPQEILLQWKNLLEI